MTPNKEYTVKPFSDEHVNPAAGIEAAVFSEPWSARALDDIFVHYSSIRSNGYKSLVEGQYVEFELVRTDKGLQAKNVVETKTVFV